MTSDERDWSEFVPDVDLAGSKLEGGIELIKNYGIVAAYSRWTEKPEPAPGSRTESIMVSCPKPSHPDKNPSAWLNSEKNVWYCGACDEGGDIIDLGAIYYEIDYKGHPENFIELLEQMLTDIGVDIDTLRADSAEDSVPTVSPAKLSTPVTATPRARSTEAGSEGPDDDGGMSLPAGLEDVDLRWEEIVDSAAGTFMHAWMKATSPADVPNEYLFWNGLQLVGLAVGRDSFLHATTPVYPNLLTVLLGRTGAGKSRSVGFGKTILVEGLPFNRLDPSCRGVDLLPRPGSGEALREMFSWQPDDEYLGMRGLVEVDELSDLMAMASRKGSTLKGALQTLADNPPTADSSTRADQTKVVEPFMAMVTGGQPDAMGRIMSGQDQISGFANRFIFIHGTPKPRRPWNDRAHIDLTGLADQLDSIRQWAGQNKIKNSGVIDLEPAKAGPRLDEIMDWLDEVKLRPNGDIFVRLELYAMKLVAILCANRKTNVADLEIVEQVHHLIETLIPTAHRVSESISQTEVQWYQNSVLTAIERHAANGEDPPTRAQLTNSVRAAKRDRTKTSEAISHLERVGAIKKVRLESKDKRKAQDRWIINT